MSILPGSNVMKSIHGVGELMSHVVLRGGGFLPMTSSSNTSRDTVKTQTEPEKQDILVMDTKLKIIEILQVSRKRTARTHQENTFIKTLFFFRPVVHLERAAGLQDLLFAVDI